MSEEFDIKKILELQSSLVDYIAFSGGGAKGNIYSGVYLALLKSGIMRNVKAVSGSSAGAITAAFVATGIDVSDFNNLSKTTNLGNLLGKSKPDYYPGKITMNALALTGEVALKATGKMNVHDKISINAGAKPLYELMQNTIRENIAAFLIDQPTLNNGGDKLDAAGLAAAKQSRINELCEGKGKGSDTSFIEKLTELQNRVFKNEGKVFFKDLDILRELDPVKFKDLLVTATNNKTLDLKIFSAKNTPDVEIALACKASASIPLVFEPTKIDGVDYVDGGYRDNIPIKYFNQDNINQNKKVENNDIAQDITGNKDAVKNAIEKQKTLAFAFGASNDMKNSINTAIYSSKEKIQEPSAFLMQFFEKVVMKFVNFCKGRELEGVGKQKYSEVEESMYQEIREKAALGTIVLDTKKVGTLGFTDAMNNADYLVVKGYIQTMNHLDNHNMCNMKEIDPNLREKEFMLSVYEKINFDRSMATSFVDRLIGGKEAKLENVLHFCKDDAWVGDRGTPDNKEVIKDFVTILAEKRSSSPKDKGNQKTTETKSMGEMIDLLNKKTTPSSVRSDFAAAIGLNLNEKEIKDYNFKKKDFANVVKNHTISKDFRTQASQQRM